MAEVVFGGNAASSGPGEGGPTAERRRRGASQQELLVEPEPAPGRRRQMRVHQVRNNRQKVVSVI